MCRSADDCGLVLQHIAGGDSDDPGSADKSFYYAPTYAPDLKDIRVGFAAVDFDEWADPAARADFAKALETMRSLGVQLIETKLPEFPYGPVISTIISSEASSVFEPLIQSGKVDQLADPKQIAGLKAGLEIPAKDYLKAMRIRSLVQSAFRDLFALTDVLLAPSRFGPAPKVTQPLDRPSSDRPPSPLFPQSHSPLSFHRFPIDPIPSTTATVGSRSDGLDSRGQSGGTPRALLAMRLCR